MSMYRVTLRSDTPVRRSDGREINPFRIRDIFGVRAMRNYRIWEFEAADEAEVRRLYDEAKREDLPNVRGYSLASIEKLK